MTERRFTKQECALWNLYMMARDINPNLPVGDELAGRVVTIRFSKDGITADVEPDRRTDDGRNCA